MKRDLARSTIAETRVTSVCICLAVCLSSAAYAQPTAPAPTHNELQQSQLQWWRGLSLMAFADAYLSLNYNFPKPDKNNVIRAFDQDNGFALSWVGLDVTYDADPLGATVALRFGPTAGRLALDDTGQGYGLEFLEQAYVTWKLCWRITLDFGKFNTIYGAEVAESWNNYNYTRGALYVAAQPLHHTGLRASFDIGHGFSATAIAVNGWDTTLDNNTMKTFGVQLSYASDLLSVNLGYLSGPEQPDTDPDTGLEISGANGRFRHLIDFVAAVTPSQRFGLVANGDFGFEEITDGDTQSWYGASLAAQVMLTDAFAVALRGEYVADPDGARLGVADQDIVTGTLTLGYAPIKQLLIRLENRLDWADKAIFLQDDEAERESYQFTTTLGVVVYAG